MDAPKCQKIPSCGKSHYGECGTTTDAERRAAKRPAKKLRRKAERLARKKKSKKIKIAAGFYGNEVNVQTIEGLIARLESLEARVLELESRKKYMRDYMREKRAEGK